MRGAEENGGHVGETASGAPPPGCKAPGEAGRRSLRASLFLTASVCGDTMGDPAYAHGKFLEAIERLATGPDDVKGRLWPAYLCVHMIKEDDLPQSVREDFLWVEAQLTKRDPLYNHKGEVISGSVNQSLFHMRRSTGVKIAKRLLRIYLVLDDYVREHGLGPFGFQEPTKLRRRFKVRTKKN
jgi:hypothetical protein